MSGDLILITEAKLSELVETAMRKIMEEGMGDSKLSHIDTNGFDFVPIQQIFGEKDAAGKRRGGLLSKPAFYDRVRRGEISIFKVGNKSFVRRKDFEALFRQVEIRRVERLKKIRK